MRNVIMFIVKFASLALLAGCGKIGSSLPTQACVCEALWNDPQCQGERPHQTDDARRPGRGKGRHAGHRLFQHPAGGKTGAEGIPRGI